MTALHDLTIAEAAPLLKARKLSPVELTAAYLSRIERFDGQLNAYLRVLPDEAMRAARKAEAEIAKGEYKGPLHGVPIALKDIYNTAGIPTTGHSALYRDHMPAEDATTTRLLAEAGTILLGKLSTWEFAIGGTSFDLPWPPARNPWNTEHDPAGSSSGSGAAIGAGLAMGTMGTDTGGSIRGPAAWCGIAGLKPTYGLVSRRGILPLSFSLDHGGPMCWTSEDCALMMDALAGHDPLDPGSADVPKPDFAGSVGRDIRGLRVGVVRHFFEADAEIDPEIKAGIEAALVTFRELGCSVEDVTLAPLATYGDAATLISRAEAYAFHEQALVATPELYGELARQRIMMGAFVRACDYVNALRERGRLIAGIAKVFESVDVLITPTMPGVAPKLGDLGNMMSRARPSFTRAFNLTGSPALSVCSGFSKAGLPLNMQIIGRPFQDDLVLRFGNAFEKATAFRDMRPAQWADHALAAE
jgi:aspartyl-tRNA(Asn)/glutamyl-tRNA(Gln) amidotransferase subunit A